MRKQIKDYFIKLALGDAAVPKGLFELQLYLRNKGPINFSVNQEDGVLIAVSKNFRYGSIVTQGESVEELKENIVDAVLTAFEIPSAYAQEARLHFTGEQFDPDKVKEYALA